MHEDRWDSRSEEQRESDTLFRIFVVVPFIIIIFIILVLPAALRGGILS